MNIIEKIEKYLNEIGGFGGGAIPGPTVRNNTLPKKTEEDEITASFTVNANGPIIRRQLRTYLNNQKAKRPDLEIDWDETKYLLGAAFKIEVSGKKSVVNKWANDLRSVAKSED